MPRKVLVCPHRPWINVQLEEFHQFLDYLQYQLIQAIFEQHHDPHHQRHQFRLITLRMKMRMMKMMSMKVTTTQMLQVPRTETCCDHMEGTAVWILAVSPKGFQDRTLHRHQ